MGVIHQVKDVIQQVEDVEANDEHYDFIYAEIEVDTLSKEEAPTCKALLMEDACKEVKVDTSKEVPVLVMHLRVVVNASKEVMDASKVVVDTSKESAIQNISTGSCKGLSVCGSKVYDAVRHSYCDTSLMMFLILKVHVWVKKLGGIELGFIWTYKLTGGRRCDSNSTGPPCTGWVEMMAPVFSRGAWHCMWRRKKVGENRILGYFKIMGVPSVPKGIPEIGVSMDLGASNILRVFPEAVSPQTHQPVMSILEVRMPIVDDGHGWCAEALENMYGSSLDLSILQKKMQQ
ncbi:hypothetical protein GIB67_022375 [Kingdonia uniflora]|uniref:Uncharacterized protein n=1 Tax=Kingdonia uniflora TaxID=39325 RepID=A0A7J7N6E7_9MAGN|nr:hypothetical protein GIB67_022375 [Kingdonia uniflora]